MIFNGVKSLILIILCFLIHLLSAQCDLSLIHYFIEAGSRSSDVPQVKIQIIDTLNIQIDSMIIVPSKSDGIKQITIECPDSYIEVPFTWIVETGSKEHIFFDTLKIDGSADTITHVMKGQLINPVKIGEHKWKTIGDDYATHDIWILNDGEDTVLVEIEATYFTRSDVRVDRRKMFSGQILIPQKMTKILTNTEVDHADIIKKAKVSITQVYHLTKNHY